MSEVRDRSAVVRKVVLALTLVCGVAFAGPNMQAATTWLFTITIGTPPAVPGSPDAGVFSDIGTSQTDEYQDHQLPDDPTTGSIDESLLNECVRANTQTNGSLFVTFNRPLDNEGTRCNPSVSGEGIRQFYLFINNRSACEELDANGYSPEWNPADPPRGLPCRIDGGHNPRIGVGNLWAKSPKVAINFLTRNPTPGHPISYEIQSLSNATVVASSAAPNVRTVNYVGNARLFKFGAGRTHFIGDAFALPFSMVFVRTAQ